MKWLPQAAKFAVLGGLLSLGLARVSGHVTSSLTEPTLRTSSVPEAERTQALLASAELAASWGENRATDTLKDLIAPRERVVDVRLYDVNRRLDQTFALTMDGQVRGATAKDVSHFFRCRRSNRRHKMDPRVLRILADLSNHFDGATIEIISAYRRPGIGVKRSKHYRGRAIDLRVRGVALHKVRDYLWTKYKDLGLGHYHQQRFLHVDYRKAKEKIAWSQKREGQRYRYNPWWARKLSKEMAEEPHEHEDGMMELGHLSEGAVAVAELTPPPAPAKQPKKAAKKQRTKRAAKKRASRRKRLAKRTKRTQRRKRYRRKGNKNDTALSKLPDSDLSNALSSSSSPKAPW